VENKGDGKMAATHPHEGAETERTYFVSESVAFTENEKATLSWNVW